MQPSRIVGWSMTEPMQILGRPQLGPCWVLGCNEITLDDVMNAAPPCNTPKCHVWKSVAILCPPGRTVIRKAESVYSHQLWPFFFKFAHYSWAFLSQWQISCSHYIWWVWIYTTHETKTYFLTCSYSKSYSEVEDIILNPWSVGVACLWKTHL